MMTITTTWKTVSSRIRAVRLFTGRPRRRPGVLDAVLGGSGGGLDPRFAGRLVERGEAVAQLLQLAQAGAQLGHDRGRHVQRLLAQRPALVRQVDPQLAFVERIARPDD